MSSCVSSPTLTQYGEITTQVVTTSFSESVTTIGGGVTTILSTTCAPITSGNLTTSSCTVVETTSPLDPTVITTNVAIPITTIITSSTPTGTLYGTSCRNGGTPNQPPVTPPVTTPSSSSTSFSSSSSLSVSTMISTFRNGSVTTVTSTSVVPVSVAVTPTTSGSSVNIGAIVGGVVGGIAGLAIIIFLLRFFFFRKKPPFSGGDDLDDLDQFYENKHLSKPSHNRGSAGIDEAYGGSNPPMSPDPASSNRVSSPGGYSYNNAGVGSSTGVSGPQSDISSLNRGPSTGATTAMSGTSVYSPNPPQPMPGVGPGAQMSPGHFGPNGVPYGPGPVNPMFPMVAAVDPGMHRRGPSVGSGDANGNRQSYYSGPGSAPLSEGGSTLSSGGSFSANSRTPLTVANPTPTAGAAAAAAATAYPRDVKDRTIYLNDAGYQVRGTQNGPESSQAGSSSGPVIQHSDGGAVSPPPQPTPQQEIPAQVVQPQQDQSGPSSRRPFVHADSDFDERLAGSASPPPPRNPKRAEAEQDAERHEEAPPPAYEE
ncbi:hypothetical protein NLI96_g6488 [Meripilus lineatus]|uniref:Mid2 domain-containing protein n=1 Tax=Meripilus lineatus TaxID=2056292 RepID=A0AAD5YCW9_9APHY|nr:hypothetical protein NLI96_g6488 [Physisporinus lineatus]